MEPTPLIDSALLVILFDNALQNTQRLKPFEDLVTSADLDIAFTEAEGHPYVDLDTALNRLVGTLAQGDLSSTDELVEVAVAVNRLRRSREIEYLIPVKVMGHLKRNIQSLMAHKRMYEQLRDQEAEEKQRQSEFDRRSTNSKREERVRRRDAIKTLENQLNQKKRELAAAQESLQTNLMYARGLEQSLECSICQQERWDTVTGCGHVFGEVCIKLWLKSNIGWVEDMRGGLRPAGFCPVCRETLDEEDLRPVFV